MFCRRYHKQPILVALNRNTNRSEVFREPTALTANLAAIWPWLATQTLCTVPVFPSGRATDRRQGLVATLALPQPEWASRARSPSALDFPCTKSDAAWRDVAVHVIAPAQEDDPVTSRI
jgi:hypothetical protein